MYGYQIPVTYCDDQGNEYFTDAIRLPVMSDAELVQIRERMQTFTEGWDLLDGEGQAVRSSYFGSWWHNTFGKGVLDMAAFYPDQFFSNTPEYYAYNNLLFNAHNVTPQIMSHCPYRTEVISGIQSRVYTYYLKTDNGIIGPIELRFSYNSSGTEINGIEPTTLDNVAGSTFVGSGYSGSDISYTRAFARTGFAFYTLNEETQGLIFHYLAPDSLLWSNISGFFNGYYGPDDINNTLPTTACTWYGPMINFLRHAGGELIDMIDPYNPGGNSGTIPPGGYIGPQPSDVVEIPDPPTTSFVNGGFCRIYNPDWAQLRALASYLWTDSTFLQTLVNHAKQLLEDPMEAVIALNLIPVSIPQGTPEQVKIMYIPITGVSMPPALRQFVQVDCGSYYLQERYASALDYNPYTKLSLFLPFIGTVSINPDEVMNHTISIKYNVDIVTGTCVAFVAVDGCVFYQYSGNCAVSMPLNSADFSNWISAAISAGIALAAPVAGAAGVSAGAATQAVAAEGAEAATSTALTTTGEHALQLYSGAPNLNQTLRSEIAGKAAEYAEFGRKLITNTVGAVAGSKTHFEHTGQFSGFSGFLGQRRPFLILESPKMCNPDEYGVFNGRPAMVYRNLGMLSGYTEIQEIHLTGFSATNPELSEIASLLKAGVIL